MADDRTPAPPGTAAAPPPPLLAPATPVRTGLSLLVPLLSIVALLLLMLIGAGGGLRWLLVTENGSAWLLQRLPVVEVKGFKGALVGPTWRADSVRLSWDGGKQSVFIEGLAADDLRWQWQPHEHAWLGLRASSLTARRVTVVTGPAGGGPIVLPARLAPPLQLVVDRVQLETLVIDGSEVAQRLRAQGLQLDPRPAAAHHVDSFEFQAQTVQVNGQARIANTQPFALAVQAALRPALEGDAPAWAAVLRASGALQEMVVDGTLRGRPQGKLAAPTLDLRAQLRPLQPWMLAGLELRTEALDLAALRPGAPSTRLSGRGQLQGGQDGRPLQAELQLDNGQPGRWDEGRLPLRQLKLALRSSLQQPERVDLSDFELLLADTGGNAGRYSGSGVWQGHTLTLDTRVDGLAPQRVDGRAAAMTLTGPVQLSLAGLPSPDWRGAAAPAAAAAAPPLSVQWKVDLQGRLQGRAQAVQLQLEGQADGQGVELRRASAVAGSARAELTAKLSRGSRNDWQLATRGSVSDFDPLPWWPGEAGGAWRRGPHRLSGDWSLDLRLPAGAERLQPLALAQRAIGNGTLQVQRSVLAGVPLAAELTLAYAPQAGPTPASLRGQLQLGGNLLRIDGRGDPGGSGSGDHWQLDLQAQTLAALAPLAALHPALAAWAPRQGSLVASFSADGRWPAMRSAGSAQLSQLQAGTLAVARANASWGMDTTQAQQPLAMKVDVAGLAYGAHRADNLRLDLGGTLAEHRIDISGTMPVLPPVAAERLLGIQLQSGTRAQLQAQGQWLPNTAAGGGRWKAQIQRLTLGSWDGSSATATAPGWLETRNLSAELEFDADARLLALQASAGRVAAANGLALRWDEVNVDLRGTLPQLRLRADVEAFAVAPLLARLQPTMGWQGDLRLAAHVDVRAAEKMDAELVVERVDGDLHVAGNDSTQLLGLSELRLAVSAHEGLWHFRPQFRGRSIGELAGQLQVQSSPERRWPQPEAPVSGELTARVADIGIWSAWLPPGWRLRGAVNTTAVLSGPFRNPLVNGELSGNGLGVRNLLQGVNVRDGDVLIKLAGDVAKVERFTLRGGDGSASITGSAQLAGKPELRLQLKAERFRLLGRVDRMVTASGNAELLLGAERTQIDGKFRIDEGHYDANRSDAPTLDDDVTLGRNGEAFATTAEPGAAPPKRAFVMGIDIDLGDKVRVRGRGLDTGLRGQLRLTTPGGRLAVHGSINTDGGTYAAYGQALEIERGIVAFSGVPDNPRLDVLALRPKIDQRVGVAVTGNLLTPRVRLYSDPEMSDSEKLSWLVLGRASDGLGRDDTALLQRAAVALLSGEGEAPTDALMKSLGIDEISLRQSEGDVRETVITVGKQLSRRWYLGYERGVNATTGTWQLIYRIAQRFTLRAQSGLDSAVDVIWTWRTQETPADAGMRKSVVTPQ